MTTLFFDCFAGASGDMILGALVDLGVEPDYLKEQLDLLGVSGFSLEFGRVDRSGIGASKVTVNASHEHHHRHLSDILKIVGQSRLSDAIKTRIEEVFTRLAEAEAKVHAVPIEKIHFHEVGAIDAIVDVAGACIGFDRLGIDRFFCSPLHVGSGMIEMAHGRFPIPPPAVVELLKGAPIYSGEIVGELVTPTGAAIISTVAKSYGPMPRMTVGKVGYGAGTREYDRFPNVLRLVLGDLVEEDDSVFENLLMLETNIDDMNPQFFGPVMERALELGALDCFFTSVQMKKGRPGTMVSILCNPDQRSLLTDLLLTETTTLGVRSYEVQRTSLNREILTVVTEYGPIRVKVGLKSREAIKSMPEFEDCLKAAHDRCVTLADVTQAAISELKRQSPKEISTKDS